ncbi:hypothetical protein [Hymenobacter weizhouensis]|uniref:hypothetical protein n=1 Tax=Hymenobacter sp. YIM 151500-1 TaxID=2987689 RepID=UPI0022268F34|nr:hypothetical protein [Hymenobacter sp. YIM 151500-1]UYZ62849.1 hypothetical protein OIS53_17860 [Hymenobacter sp. YIM 151500-1]
MKTFSVFRPALAAALLLTSSLVACNTGTEAGDTNVERGAVKTKDPSASQSSTVTGDSATSGTARQNPGPSNRKVYEDAADRKDRNNDGLAD